MDVFVGQTRSRKLIARLMQLGFGECVGRREWPPRRRPAFQDNDAFRDWQQGRDFDNAAFLSTCALANADPVPPVFSACPDRVATGLASLAFSLRWLDMHASAFPALRWYLVVQDGMGVADVQPVMDRFTGIFVGGTLAWKIATGAMWCQLAHELGKRCHIGRVGTAKRVRWAMRIGVDSIDSSAPLWADANLARFVNALDARQQEFAL